MSVPALLLAAGGAYAASTVALAVAGGRVGSARGRAAVWLPFAVGFALVSAAIAKGWIELGHPPFRSLGGSLPLWAWCGSLALLVLGWRSRSAALGAGTSALLAGVALLAWRRAEAAGGAWSPALGSSWFLPHVLSYLVGYGALLVATVAAALVLLGPRTAGAAAEREGRAPPRTALAADALMERAARLGFFGLSVGMVLGAFWAKQAWGDYWTWDPKESWALLTWIAYALYFHVRRLPGWRGRRSAWLLVAGFFVVVFTYLGIGALPTAGGSVHVY